MHGRHPIALVVALALAACSPNPSATPGPSAGASNPVATPAPTTAPTSTLAAVILPSKSDTASGRIWDGVPPWFPLPAGAKPVEPGPEPVSGLFDVPASAGTARQVADTFKSAIAAVGPSGVQASIDGPLEDGSFTVGGGVGYSLCKFEVRVAPLGDLTRVTILYGEFCPYY